MHRAVRYWFDCMARRSRCNLSFDWLDRRPCQHLPLLSNCLCHLWHWYLSNWYRLLMMWRRRRRRQRRPLIPTTLPNWWHLCFVMHSLHFRLMLADSNHSRCFHHHSDLDLPNRIQRAHAHTNTNAFRFMVVFGLFFCFGRRGWVFLLVNCINVCFSVLNESVSILLCVEKLLWENEIQCKILNQILSQRRTKKNQK